MAAESSRTFLLLAVLVLGIFADPCETQELRCQCIQTHSPFIPFKFISKVQLILEGAYCSRKEIMIVVACAFILTISNNRQTLLAEDSHNTLF
ncbi:C-X-C motif chemokine 15-like isoform X3 [Sturnira hondurensis]|uniref:C-X-C motif chemokine 15-like isoform X3 n=1 Tax=Sturnira hondurensis TaxID=192404 RepID=UPI00187A08D6|nr:C-X-C motif chemokine 15-like isoform X3 [Sturnira hondurensis]